MDSEAIGIRLRKLRGNKTLSEVSKALGITRSALSQYENGKRIPRDNIKIRISDYYKVPIYEIFFA